VTDREQYRDLRRTEGPSSPAGRLPFGEAKPLRLRRIDPGGARSPGDTPAPGSGAGAFVLTTVPAGRGNGRLQAVIAALLSFLLLGSLTALAFLGSGGLPGAPVVRPGIQLEQEVVRESPVEALPAPSGGVAGAPGQAGQVDEDSAEAPTTTPAVVDETGPPGVIPAQGGQDAEGDEGQGGDGGGGSGDDDDAGGQDETGDQGGIGGEGETGGEGDTGGEGEAVGGGPAEVAPDGSEGGEGKVVGKVEVTGKGHQKAKGQGHGTGQGKGHANDAAEGGVAGDEPGKGKIKGKGKSKDSGAAGQPAGGPSGSAGGHPPDDKGKGNGKGSGG
jgi:hypothetical protein